MSKITGSYHIITKESHPFLVEAFETIDHDSGRRIGMREEPISYQIPIEYHINRMEIALRQLDKEQREILAIGDVEEMLELCQRNPELEEVSFMLDKYFYDGADWRNVSSKDQEEKP